MVVVVVMLSASPLFGSCSCWLWQVSLSSDSPKTLARGPKSQPHPKAHAYVVATGVGLLVRAVGGASPCDEVGRGSCK